MKARALGSLILALAGLSTAAAAPVWAQEEEPPPPIDCGPDDGREALTTDGFRLQFEAPAPPAPELGATLGVTGPVLTRHRSAHLPFRANFLPHASGDLKFDLTWTNSSDFDLYVFDAEGTRIASSDAINLTEGNPTGESATVQGVLHCTDLTVEVRNWAGRIDEQLTLDIRFQNPGPLLACAKDDPAPACAGVEEGQPPVRLPDPRTRMYLGGDRPGQLSHAGHWPFALASQGDPPLKGTLSSVRPVGGRSNSVTHLALGNQNQHENPFYASFSLPVDAPKLVSGTVHALVWVSSQTLKDGGTLNVDLWRDGTGALTGTLIQRVVVPGTAVGTVPTPIAVTFTGVSAVVESELVLQVSSPSVANTGGIPPNPSTGNPADAEWTLYYDSVQFPSHLALRPLTDAPQE